MPIAAEGCKKMPGYWKQPYSSLGTRPGRFNCPLLPLWRSRLSAYRFKALERLCPGFLSKLFYRTQVALLRLLHRGQRADLVIHLENIWISQLAAGRHHWLIPNQEWFIESRGPYLSFTNRILCKTQHAVSIFSALHADTHYLGFYRR